MKKHVIILGAGISGLSLRYFLSKKYPDLKITLLEKSSRIGGLIHSQKNQGFFFERGPRTFKASKNHDLLDLIDDLNLEKEIISSQAKKRFLWKDQKLQTMPRLIIKALPALLKEWSQQKGEGDETIYDFASRRFGPFAAQTFFDPLVTGIFAGDIRKLSILSCFPQLKELEQKYGSISRGLFAKKKKRTYPKNMKPGSLFTLKRGLSSLTYTLVKKGRGEIKLNTAAESFDLDADHIFCALSSAGAQELTKNCDPTLYAFFDTLPRASLSAVQLGYHLDVLKEKGFGYLIPSSENQNVLGSIFDSAVFPQQSSHQGETRLTVMTKGKQPLLDALHAMREHLGILEQPIWSQVTSYPSVIPQFTIGHEKRKKAFLEAAAERLPNVSFLGNYLDGVSINHCIERAQACAKDSL